MSVELMSRHHANDMLICSSALRFVDCAIGKAIATALPPRSTCSVALKIFPEEHARTSHLSDSNLYRNRGSLTWATHYQKSAGALLLEQPLITNAPL